MSCSPCSSRSSIVLMSFENSPTSSSVEKIREPETGCTINIFQSEGFPGGVSRSPTTNAKSQQTPTANRSRHDDDDDDAISAKKSPVLDITAGTYVHFVTYALGSGE